VLYNKSSNEISRHQLLVDVSTSVCACTLFVLGLFKVLSLYGDKQYLGIVDPTTGLTNKWLFSVVGTIELSLAVAHFKNIITYSNLRVCLGMCAIAIWSYRIIRTLTGVVAPCACLGRFGEDLNFTQGEVDATLLSILILFTALGTYESIAIVTARCARN
jgi:hypothetical protein